MPNFNLDQATGLTPQELSEVFQRNPRAYMAVRGAVSEKHLEKVIHSLKKAGIINNFQTASGDMDKDFYLEVNGQRISLECKNVEVIKTNNKKSIISYLEYLTSNYYLSAESISSILTKLGFNENDLLNLSTKKVTEFFKHIPQKYRESGLTKYSYSASQIEQPVLGTISDYDFVAQFEGAPITIDFQRTRNSTDQDGDTKRNRYYRVGEIDIVAACLFSRTMEWRFLYAKTDNFERHKTYSDRYSNRLIITPGLWTSDIIELLQT